MCYTLKLDVSSVALIEDSFPLKVDVILLNSSLSAVPRLNIPRKAHIRRSRRAFSVRGGRSGKTEVL